MSFDPEIHQRRSIRLVDYDYTSTGFYFVTICVQGQESLLGEVVDGEVVLNDAGQMVENIWQELPIRYPGIAFDEHVIMPNHFHGIIALQPPAAVGAGPCACPGFQPGPRARPGFQPGPRACPGFSGARGEGHPQREEGHPQGGAPTTIQMSLMDVVHRFKSLTTARYRHGVNNHNWTLFPGKLWQRNYYERIIRNENELHNIRQYICDNPQQWENDNENPTHNPP